MRSPRPRGVARNYRDRPREAGRRRSAPPRTRSGRDCEQGSATSMEQAMKRHLRTWLSAFLFMHVNHVAWAAGFTGAWNVVGYDVGDTSALIIRLDQGNSCGSVWVRVSSSMPYYKDMLAMTVTAYVAGKP